MSGKPEETAQDRANDVELVLIDNRFERGIYIEPLQPGSYNLNTKAYTAYMVPTSAIMVDWATSERPSAPSMSRPEATPAANISDYPYLTDPTAKGVSFFQFGQLEVVSLDGFELQVDVRMVIRIKQENAAFVIARFGSVLNLIQQIVHPLIDSSFRNSAGEKKALEFFQSRANLQSEALAKAIVEFAKYHVEAQNLLISYINIKDKNLLDTQTQKAIAIQQQQMYQEQTNAQIQRIELQAKTAQANKQADVIAAQLQININENNAKALVKQAEGIRDSTRIQADGQAAAVRKVGEAQADAYHAQADVLGAPRVAAVEIMNRVKEGQIQITPQTLVTSGPGGDATSATLVAYLVTLLNKEDGSKLTPYERKEEDDFVSTLTQTSTPTPPTPTPSPPGMVPMPASMSASQTSSPTDTQQNMKNA